MHLEDTYMHTYARTHSVTVMHAAGSMCNNNIWVPTCGHLCQHEFLDVTNQYRVMYSLKDILDVVCVCCGGEVVIHVGVPGCAHHIEHVHHKGLYILHITGVSHEIGKTILDVFHLDFLLQKICLVEEKDYGNVSEAVVVDNGLKDAPALHQSIGESVLHQILVKLWGSYQKKDRCHIVKALEPLLPLWPLTSYINESEIDSLDLEPVVDDVLCSLSRVQNIF